MVEARKAAAALSAVLLVAGAVVAPRVVVAPVVVALVVSAGLSVFVAPSPPRSAPNGFAAVVAVAGFDSAVETGVAPPPSSPLSGFCGPAPPRREGMAGAVVVGAGVAAAAVDVVGFGASPPNIPVGLVSVPPAPSAPNIPPAAAFDGALVVAVAGVVLVVALPLPNKPAAGVFVAAPRPPNRLPPVDDPPAAGAGAPKSVLAWLVAGAAAEEVVVVGGVPAGVPPNAPRAPPPPGLVANIPPNPDAGVVDWVVGAVLVAPPPNMLEVGVDENMPPPPNAPGAVAPPPSRLVGLEASTAGGAPAGVVEVAARRGFAGVD